MRRFIFRVFQKISILGLLWAFSCPILAQTASTDTSAWRSRYYLDLEKCSTRRVSTPFGYATHCNQLTPEDSLALSVRLVPFESAEQLALYREVGVTVFTDSSYNDCFLSLDSLRIVVGLEENEEELARYPVDTIAEPLPEPGFALRTAIPAAPIYPLRDWANVWFYALPVRMHLHCPSFGQIRVNAYDVDLTSFRPFTFVHEDEGKGSR